MDLIGIICAMNKEANSLKEKMTDVNIESHASMDYYSGKLSGKNVVVVRSGTGKVNAAVAAEILAGIFKVDAIINTGIAGSLNKDINIGDVVLSTDAIEHDIDQTTFGFKKGINPDQPESIYTADPELRKIAKEACEKACPYIGVFEGRVLSGDQFISDPEIKDEMVELFGGLCVEMEGAAIAHTAWLNQIPYLVIRAISDKADDSADMDYPTFQKMAVENSVKIITEMMGMM